MTTNDQTQQTLEPTKRTPSKRGARGKGKGRGNSYRTDTFYQTGSNTNKNLERDREIQELTSFSKRDDKFYEFTPGAYPTIFDEPMTEVNPVAHFDVNMYETMRSIDEQAQSVLNDLGDHKISGLFVASCFLALASKSTLAADQYNEPRLTTLSKIINLSSMIPSMATTISSVLGNFKTEDGDFRLNTPGWYATRFAVCFLYTMELVNRKDHRKDVSALKVWNKFRRLSVENTTIKAADENLFDPIEINLALESMYEVKMKQYNVNQYQRRNTADTHNLNTSCISVPRVFNECGDYKDVITLLGGQDTINLLYGDWLNEEELLNFLAETTTEENQLSHTLKGVVEDAKTKDIEEEFLSELLNLALDRYRANNLLIAEYFPLGAFQTSGTGSRVQSVIYYEDDIDTETKLLSRFKLTSQEQQICALTPMAFLIKEEKYSRRTAFERTMLRSRLDILRPYFTKVYKVRAQPEISIT